MPEKPEVDNEEVDEKIEKTLLLLKQALSKARISQDRISAFMVNKSLSYNAARHIPSHIKPLFETEEQKELVGINGLKAPAQRMLLALCQKLQESEGKGDGVYPITEISIMRGLKLKNYPTVSFNSPYHLAQFYTGKERPTSSDVKSSLKALEELNQRTFHIWSTRRKGKELSLVRTNLPLIPKMEIPTKKEIKEGKEAIIALHPVFTDGIENNFILYQENTVSMLRDVSSPAIIQVIHRLKIAQNNLHRQNETTLTRDYLSLAEKTELLKYIGKDHKYIKNTIIKACEKAIEMGMINSYSFRKRNKKTELIIIEFNQETAQKLYGLKKLTN